MLAACWTNAASTPARCGSRCVPLLNITGSPTLVKPETRCATGAAKFVAVRRAGDTRTAEATLAEAALGLAGLAPGV